MMKKLIFILITNLAFTLSLIAQIDHIKYERLTTEDGLSNHNTEDVLQDRQGFIWFATRNGINRYDGQDFKVYKHDSDNPFSLGDNSTNELYEDQSGAIWVGLFSEGLDKFDPETEQFIHYRHDPTDSTSISSNDINDMFGDRAGYLWIATYNGLNKLNLESETFTRYQHDPYNSQSLADNTVISIMEDHTGQFWVGGTLGLQKFDPATGVFSTLYSYNLNDPNSLSNNTVFCIYEDRESVLWVGTQNGLNRFDREKEKFTTYYHDPDDPTSLSDNQINSLFEDSSGRFWIGTPAGVNLFDRKTGKVRRYYNDPNNETTLAGDHVHRIYEDGSGIVWLVGDEVTKFDPLRNRFTTYRHEPDNPNSLGNSWVHGIYETKDSLLWIGTFESGLYRFDRSIQQFTLYGHNLDDPNSLRGHSKVLTLSGDDQSLWMATWGAGVRKLIFETEEFISFLPDPTTSNSLSYEVIVTLLVSKSGKVWIGTQERGLDIYDPVQDKFTHYPHNPDDPNSLSANYVATIYEDSQGQIWVGTWGGGLNLYNPTTNGFIHYKNEPNDTTSLSNNAVWMLHEDAKGQLWIATGGGLNRFDQEKETFTHYFEKDGLASQVVLSILEDEQGHLWLGTSGGLSRFNPQTETFRNYDIRDGLPDNQFSAGCAYKSLTGELLFGSKGLIVFKPEDITDNPYIPSVVITDFKLFNKSVAIGGDSPLQKSIRFSEGLTLTHKQSIFSFEFASLNYSAPGKNLYKYKLEGLEENWNEVDSKHRFAMYTNLNAGEYIFRVLGSNNDGVWNEIGTSLQITILPPWWKTVWVRLIAIIIFLSLGPIIFYLRTKSLRARKKALEGIVEARTSTIIVQKNEIEEAMDQLRKSQSQLVQSEKMASLGVLTAGIAHEINNPINFVYSGINSLKKDYKDISEILHLLKSSPKEATKLAEELELDELMKIIPETIEDIKNGANRTSEIVKGLRNFTRLDDSDLKMADIHEGINSTLLILKSKFKDRIELIKNYDNSIPEISCFPGQLNQVFMNVINNAIDAIEEEGRIEIITTQDKNNVIISIKDSGKGMSDEVKEKIFDPFFTTKDVGEGVGLGMSISHGIIEKHGGQIKVISEVGSGSEFVIILLKNEK
jgi:signal transduction histidine kinase/ligand-binding sensor domain-containing protein